VLWRTAQCKLLKQINVNLVNNCDFFLELIIPVREGHFDFSSRAPKKKLSAPLTVSNPL
jgi:hypothetical protein